MLRETQPNEIGYFEKSFTKQELNVFAFIEIV